jgi:hypothetical protein
VAGALGVRITYAEATLHWKMVRAGTMMCLDRYIVTIINDGELDDK